jgi:transposase InsO family protein
MKPDGETLPLPLDAPLRAGADPELTSDEAANLLKITERGTRKNCDEERQPGAFKDPSGAWRIPLSSLPHLAQARYWAKHRNEAPSGWEEAERRQLPEEEYAELWRRFEAHSQALKKKAFKDAEAFHVWRILTAKGLHYSEKLSEMKASYGMGKSTVYDKLKIIRGYEPLYWPALLVGQWAGDNAKRVAFPPLSWGFFMRHALAPGAKIKTAWRRTLRQAEKEGWGAIPSYDTFLNDFNALPHDIRTLAKQGETALNALSPTLKRDYEALSLHELWSLDGRRLDLMVRDTKGKYGPAGRVFRLWMYALMEVRARYLVGYALGDALTADLVRNAFLNALKTTGRYIPRGIQADNGMEIAAKENTGGIPFRRRGKVMENEIIGLFPMLDISVSWANVAHGQSKPVERLFGTLASMVETRPEFRGAYCGNSPEARPEEWGADKAVDVEILEAILREEIAAYHKTPHRGQGMHRKSPFQVYSDEMPRSLARKICDEQARACILSREKITIRGDGGFTLLGFHCYSEETTRLARGAGYYAAYNPADLSDEIYVYRGQKLVARARKVEFTAFNDKEAAKTIAKTRRTYIKKVKEQYKAVLDLKGADTPEYLAGLRAEVMGESVNAETGEILPAGKVLEIVKSAADMPTDKKTPAQEEAAAIKAEAERLRKLEGSPQDRILKKRRLGLC